MALQSFVSLILATYKLYRENFQLFMKLGFLLLLLPTIIFEVPATLYEMQLPVNPVTEKVILDGTAIALNALSTIVMIMLGLLFSFTIIKALVSRPKGVMDALEAGKSYLGTGFVVAILLLFGLTGLFFLLIIPGIIFSIYWMFAYYAHILDGEGIIASIRQSMAVVRGRWWRTFGFSLLFFLLSITVIAFASIFIIIPGLILALVSPIAGTVLVIMIMGVIQMLATPFSLVFMERFYVDLKENPVKK